MERGIVGNVNIVDFEGIVHPGAKQSLESSLVDRFLLRRESAGTTLCL